MGVWEPEQKMEYAMVASSIKTNTYICFMENQAKKAALRLYNTGKLTVIVQDNASIHRVKKQEKNKKNGKNWDY